MSRFRRCVRRSDAGLSLIELLLVIGMSALFIGAVYEAVITGLRVVDAADDREDVRQQLAGTLDRFTREAAVASNVRNATSSRFRFDGDLDADGTVESAETQIDYELESGDLMRDDDANPNVTLMEDVASVAFSYTDLNGNSWSSGDEDDIRVVHVTLSATRSNETITLAGAAYLRNNQ